MENCEIEINAVAWDSLAAVVLSKVGNPDDYAMQIQAGASLFQVKRGGLEIGLYLLRVDQLANSAEGVLVAAVSHDPHVDLTALVLPVIEKQFIGCRSIRIHTARPGLAKKLSRAGYSAAELVLRKPL